MGRPEELSTGRPDGLAGFDRSLLAADSLRAARALLGALLVSEPSPGARVTLRITEVEAYAGVSDPASHAWRGRTPRTAVMFGPAGFAYVYFSYGMHWCVNVTAGPEGEAAAVLLRAGTVTGGAEVAAARRPGIPPRDWARGPARLTKTLGITRAEDGLDLCSELSPVRLSPGAGVPDSGVMAGPRVGVSRAAEEPWRLWIRDDPSVSVYRRSPRAAPARLSAREH